jgi:hypothetical protein
MHLELCSRDPKAGREVGRVVDLITSVLEETLGDELVHGCIREHRFLSPGRGGLTVVD